MKHADKTASLAGHALAMARWQSTKPDRLIAELHDRADQLGDKQISDLRSLVDEATEKESS